MENLKIIFHGRLDTISSPELLSFYENSIKNIKEKFIILDCADLEYVSSAGLRVFLIMYKSTGGNVKVINANETVDDILDQTGFKEFLMPEQ